jgi:hypothetical protein
MFQSWEWDVDEVCLRATTRVEQKIVRAKIIALIGIAIVAMLAFSDADISRPNRAAVLAAFRIGFPLAVTAR